MPALQEPPTEKATCCELCGREDDLTAHHLIPKSRHNKPRMLKRYDRRYMRSHIAMICYPCHKNLHKVLTEQEMAEEYNEVELLAAHPGVAKFTNWIRNKPSGWRP